MTCAFYHIIIFKAVLYAKLARIVSAIRNLIRQKIRDREQMMKDEDLKFLEVLQVFSTVIAN